MNLDGIHLSVNEVVIALEASQVSMDGVEVGFSKCPHGLTFTTLRVESLGTKSLARPSLLSGGRSWGLFDLYFSFISPRWYPHISESFKLPFSYELRVPKDIETILQSPYHDPLFVYVDALKARLRFPLHYFIVDFFNSSNLTITQLPPNFWAILSAFVILCRLLEIEPFVGVF